MSEIVGFFDNPTAAVGIALLPVFIISRGMICEEPARKILWNIITFKLIYCACSRSSPEVFMTRASETSENPVF
jgi:hypothetical protein